MAWLDPLIFPSMVRFLSRINVLVKIGFIPLAKVIVAPAAAQSTISLSVPDPVSAAEVTMVEHPNIVMGLQL